MPIWEILDAIDKNIFTFIHTKASAPFLDGFMKLLREAKIWIPLYVFMVYWVLRFERKFAFPFIVLTVLTFAVNDFVSAQILKPWIERIRPCYEPSLEGIVRELVPCGGQYTFPSSHAANHFGLATFWFFTIQMLRQQKWHWLWLWAILIGYAQVYVGKHYPFDIAGGAALGMVSGYAFVRIFKAWCFPYRRDKLAPSSSNDVVPEWF